MKFWNLFKKKKSNKPREVRLNRAPFKERLNGFRRQRQANRYVVRVLITYDGKSMGSFPATVTAFSKQDASKKITERMAIKVDEIKKTSR